MISSQRHMLTHMIIYIFTITFSYDNIFIYFINKKKLSYTFTTKKKLFYKNSVPEPGERNRGILCVCDKKREVYAK